eukprot:1817633-Rhodomonas_salina.1
MEAVLWPYLGRGTGPRATLLPRSVPARGHEKGSFRVIKLLHHDPRHLRVFEGGKRERGRAGERRERGWKRVYTCDNDRCRAVAVSVAVKPRNFRQLPSD